LTGSGLVLQDDGGGDLTIAADGNFAFAPALAPGATYNVTVKSQPTVPGQTCAVANGTGTVATANVSNVTVTCTALAPRFAYVTNENSSTVVAYTIDSASGVLAPVASGSSATGLKPRVVAVDPTGLFAYVANFGGGTVSTYDVNPASGVLNGTGTVAAGTNPVSLAIEPTGRFAYVANAGSNNISVYSITNDGALAPIAGSPFATANGPVAVNIDPAGRFVYVVNQTTGVSAYAIATATGALTQVAGSPFTAGTSAYAMAIHPTGNYAYVANPGSNDVSSFEVNTTTGELKSLGVTSAGNGPFAIAIDPSGMFAYVVNVNGHNLSAYSIKANGALAALAVRPVIATGISPRSVSIDPSGKYVYVANYGDNINATSVSAFEIDATTGALEASSDVPVAAGNRPTSVITPR
jgi:6-phosphogluconolactonase (cycloisomerase 2 family)